MRKIVTGLSLLGLFGVLQSSPLPASSKDPEASLESVLNLILESAGGSEAFVAAKSIIAHGTSDSEFQSTNRFVVEQTVDGMKYSVVMEEGQIVPWSIVNKKNGWSRDPLTSQLTELSKEAAFRDLRSFGTILELTSKAATRRFEFLGRTEIDGRECYELRREYKNGDFARVRVDAKTGLLWMVVETRRLGESAYTVVRTYSDYREVDGVQLAHRIREESRAGWREFDVDRFELGVVLEPERFEPPAVPVMFQRIE